jgi:hypothetical protein
MKEGVNYSLFFCAEFAWTRMIRLIKSTNRTNESKDKKYLFEQQITVSI